MLFSRLLLSYFRLIERNCRNVLLIVSNLFLITLSSVSQRQLMYPWDSSRNYHWDKQDPLVP